MSDPIPIRSDERLVECQTQTSAEATNITDATGPVTTNAPEPNGESQPASASKKRTPRKTRGSKLETSERLLSEALSADFARLEKDQAIAERLAKNKFTVLLIAELSEADRKRYNDVLNGWDIALRQIRDAISTNSKV